MTEETVCVWCVKLDFMENSAKLTVHHLALVAVIKSGDIVSFAKMNHVISVILLVRADAER